MDRWANKVAVVTGASAGIGAAICRDLVVAGMTVVGLARRKERVEALRDAIPAEAAGRLLAFACDVSNSADVTRAFDWIVAELGTVHVLVNNAGIVRLGRVTGENSSVPDMRATLETNLWGSIECTRRAVEIMKRTGVVGAHIVLINSVAGHKVMGGSPAGEAPQVNVYPVSKFGITALAEVLRLEFNADNLFYKVTSISPGAVRTEIVAAEIFEQMKYALNAEDVSQAVLYALGTPPHVQISELIIKPVGEQF